MKEVAQGLVVSGGAGIQTQASWLQAQGPLTMPDCLTSLPQLVWEGRASCSGGGGKARASADPSSPLCPCSASAHVRLYSSFTVWTQGEDFVIHHLLGPTSQIWFLGGLSCRQ